jgi:hypothetical protein
MMASAARAPVAADPVTSNDAALACRNVRLLNVVNAMVSSPLRACPRVVNS